MPDDSDDEEVPSKPRAAPADQSKAAAGTSAQEPEEEGMQLSEAQFPVSIIPQVPP